MSKRLLDFYQKYFLCKKEKATAGNIFFEGVRLYSYGYHYLLGIYIPELNYILINNKPYSYTTRRHQHKTEVYAEKNNVNYEYVYDFDFQKTVDMLNDTIKMVQHKRYNINKYEHPYKAFLTFEKYRQEKINALENKIKKLKDIQNELIKRDINLYS